MLATLLTDFGLDDTYVGQLKAALLAVAPSAKLVDLTHGIPAQDVAAGAYQLWTAVSGFARPALHLAVVDPGVGTRRAAIAARSKGGHLFVGPNNGLLAPAIERTGGLALAVSIEDPRYVARRRSHTFHGRDVFAPAAGHLLRGLPLARLGPRLPTLEAPFRIPSREPHGEVVHVDHFGNAITSLAGDDAPAHFLVRVGSPATAPIHGGRQATYASAAPGAPLALVGSSGLIEIAINGGHAARSLGLFRGTQVELVSEATSADQKSRRPGSGRRPRS